MRQCRDDLSFYLSAGARCLFLRFDGAPTGGDEAINSAQHRLVEAAGAGRGAVGIKRGCRLAKHLDKDRRPSLDTVQGKASVVFREPVDNDSLFGSMLGGFVE